MKDTKTGPPSSVAIAAVLQEIGRLLELQGTEPFRAGAYLKAARAVAALSADLGTLVARNQLTEIAGVGRGLAAQIFEIYTTGRSPLLEELRTALPPGVLELSHLLSVKKIRQLH